MAQVKLIAATGPPLNNAGCMLPVFKKKDNKFFEVGGKDFSKGELKELIKDNAAIPFESTTPVGTGFGIKQLRWSSEEPDHYGYSAYVLYLSKEALACLGGKKPILDIGSKYSAVLSRPSKKVAREWCDHLFLLISRDGLVSGIIPELTVLCRDLIDGALTERILDLNRTATTLVEGEHDDLAQLAQIMMNLASRGTIDCAIQYYGATLSLSPMSDNFPVWLDLVLQRWNHSIRDIKYWQNRVAGVLWAAQQGADVVSDRRRRSRTAAQIRYTGRLVPTSQVSGINTVVVEGITPGRSYFPRGKQVSQIQNVSASVLSFEFRTMQLGERKKQSEPVIVYTQNPLTEWDDLETVFHDGGSD